MPFVANHVGNSVNLEEGALKLCVWRNTTILNTWCEWCAGGRTSSRDIFLQQEVTTVQSSPSSRTKSVNMQPERDSGLRPNLNTNKNLWQGSTITVQRCSPSHLAEIDLLYKEEWDKFQSVHMHSWQRPKTCSCDCREKLFCKMMSQEDECKHTPIFKGYDLQLESVY